ncbi:hypothetical protein [Streptomyces sp. NPDC046161]|uniref:hypothetical protein n=1 Tax=Streptomyces sp. NPDC046161 TaxID=3155132 RepID=UPI0033FD6FC1
MSSASRRRRRPFVVAAAALSMAVTTALGTTAHSAPQRAVTATLVSDITYQIMDHEDWGPNERCTRTDHSRDGLSEAEAPRSFAFSRTCGGEIRVEIDYKARLSHDRSIVIPEGHVKFFEGSSVVTNDEDGGLDFGFTGEPQTIIPGGESRTRSFYVQNSAEGEPDDHALVTVTWTNVKNYQLHRIGH